MRAVRAGMMLKPEDDRWFSAKPYCDGLAATEDLPDVDFWKEGGGTDGWMQMLGRLHPEALNHLLRRCSHAERPFGPEPFGAEFEEKRGRSWKRYPYEQELADSEMGLILERLTPETATAG